MTRSTIARTLVSLGCIFALFSNLAGTAAAVTIPVTSGLKAHFDADDPTTRTLVGSAVDQWAGSSGTSAIAVAPTMDHRPSLVSDAINGRDAFFFDGTADSNALDDVLRIDNLGFGNQMTAFFVLQNAPQDNNTGSCCRPFFIGGDDGLGPNTGGYGFAFKRPGTQPEEFRVDFPAVADVNESFDMLPSTLVDAGGGVFVGDGEFHIYSAIIERDLGGDDIEVFQNGFSLGSRDVAFQAEDGGGNPLLDTYYIGGVNELTGVTARKYTGQIAEIIIFNRALSPEEHAAVGSFLEFRFDLTTAFPNFQPIPEPSSASLLLAGVAGLVVYRRRRERQQAA